ncbi:BZ3500_MvSof-1268-A1-R1_Chr11-2g03402 [Microbotryum saponariae]|uniref:BZ3500_MvSof-1268-A1-R1_Chr11-2g03402 protein n=1 Tax=Microbotryum saponariae TaxID=289078 RepID=A0A2X0LE12_9BASI|nr:BZ3500_MvSof-1268-A1-R1_Chr11-2g03402 [Microbotryum saponariae]SDA03300.1 BZ3501_MvSof-1269-A2-R1_Chr11g02973 [Microbotryum saponariae]
MISSRRYAILVLLVCITVTSGAPTPDPLSLGGFGKFLNPFSWFGHKNSSDGTTTSGTSANTSTSHPESTAGIAAAVALEKADPWNNTQVCAVACAEKENGITKSGLCPELCKAAMKLRKTQKASELFVTVRSRD